VGKELLLKYFVEFQRNATSDEICISMGKERPAGAYLYGIDHEVNETKEKPFLLERKNSLTRLIRRKDFDGRLLFPNIF
jgi:hypothetical protein